MKPVRHVDFRTLVMINREVVALTGDKHEYTEEDEERIKALLKAVEDLDGREDFRAVILDKASLLTFRVASGQNFHEGDKRTALVAGLAFLEMNGFEADIKDSGLVAAVDRAGIGTATLKEVKAALKKLIRNV